MEMFNSLYDFIQEIGSSIFTGIITSFIFLLILRYLGPRIKVSDGIAQKGNQYHIKVINRSIFNAYDIKCTLANHHPYATVGGYHIRIKNIKLVRDKKDVIPGNIFSKINRLYGSNAVIFSTTENLEEIWKPESGDILYFRIVAKHGLTDIRNAREIKYRHKNVIIPGTFMFGNKIKVVQE